MIEAMPKEVAEAVILMMVKVGYVQKKGENKFHGYKYASIEDVLEKVQPALTECGLVITQDELAHAVIAEGQIMEATYAFSLSHKSGAHWGPIRHTGLASLRNTKGGYDDKALNKCHTAARKYFILGLFQIPTGLAEDPDDQEDRPEVAVRAPSPTPPRVAAPAPKDATSTAAEWAKNQTTVIRTLSSVQALADWEKKNDATLKRLEKAAPEAADALFDVIREARSKLTNFGIAAE